MNNQMVTFGDRLRSERNKLGLTQAAFGEIGGVTKKTQSLYEGGTRSPDVEYLQKITKAGVNILVLINEIGTSYINSSDDFRAHISSNKSAYQMIKDSGMLMSSDGAATVFQRLQKKEQLDKVAEDLTGRLECLEDELEILPETDDYPSVVAPPEFKQGLIDSVAKLKELGTKNIAQSKPSIASNFEDDFALIPVLDVEASAGHGATVEQEDVRYSLAFKKDWIQQEFGISPAQLRIITARGDSMDSGTGRDKDIHDGDMLLVNADVHKIEADAIYIIQVDGHVLVKRIQQMLDGSVKIISANSEYEPQIIGGEQVSDIRIAGRVVWVIAGRKA